MLLFWFLAAGLLLTALSVLLWPLLRTRRAAAVADADSAAIAVLRDQRRAADEDFASGAITGAEREAVVSDLARRVADEIDASPRAPAPGAMPRPSWPLAIALLVSIPVLAIVLYGRLGDPAAAAVAAGTEGGHELSDQQIAAMIGALERRLEQHPDNAEGWALLARSYYTLGRFPAAADAYVKAIALAPDDPDLLADYADTLGMTHGRRLAGKPLALVERALAIDPQHGKALALAATAAMEAHDPAKALVYWRRLAALVPPGSDDATQVAAVIAQLSGAAPDAAKTTPALAQPASASNGGTISGRVAVSPSLAQKVAPTDTVFIFARAPAGPRMPLAAMRIPASELPKEFTLDDAMGMAAGTKLSNAGEVIVEARLSRTGNAIAQPGDLFGKTGPVKPGASGLRITMDQVVP
ncbi:MAG TPA: c-type cytochrome biogenesis protein CcmI [Casimicrobiaceae bacterium]|jgi:cytochrome c-type biogenesis protein CcmH|nr:c-type cytochrome biogenesis protein CcmI [Casimicrobiaceae bacterium]